MSRMKDCSRGRADVDGTSELISNSIVGKLELGLSVVSDSEPDTMFVFRLKDEIIEVGERFSGLLDDMLPKNRERDPDKPVFIV